MKKTFFLIFVLLILFIGCLQNKINIKSGIEGGVIDAMDVISVIDATGSNIGYIFYGEEVSSEIYDNNKDCAYIFIDDVNIKETRIDKDMASFIKEPYPEIIPQEAIKQLELKKKQWIKKFPNKKIIEEEIWYVESSLKKRIIIGIFILYEKEGY